MSKPQKEKMFEPAALELGIKSIKNNPTSNGNENYFFSLQFINGLLQENQTLAFIIAMHAREALLPFLEEIVRRLKQNENHKNWIDMAVRLVGTIIIVGSQCFFSQYKVYSKILKQAQDYKRISSWIEQNKSKFQIRKKSEEESKQSAVKLQMSQWQVIRDLLIRIWDIDLIKQNFDRRKSVNIFISDYLLAANAKTSLEQIAFTWMKDVTETIQNQSKQNLCCKIHFKYLSESQTQKFGESNNQEFKDYRWPLQNENIVNHLAKTVVSFLNTDGGIIFVGMKEDKNKMMTANGIKFKAEEKNKFLYFIHDNILRRIFPKEPEQERRALVVQNQKVINTEGREELKKLFQKQNYEYRINKYVYVDFLEVYNGDTLMYQKQDGVEFCIARIKVKTGDPCELYHIINEMHIPEAYFREEKSVKKKSMVEFYQQFYQRMKNTKDTQAKGKAHENCRFNPKTYDPPRLK